LRSRLCYDMLYSVIIHITEWALQSYLDLVSANVFSAEEYWTTLRPDVERLKLFPSDPAFKSSKFWGPATLNGRPVADGFKMKRHNLGPGKIQLRVGVAMLGQEAYLCRGYVKANDSVDKREIAKLKFHIQRIHEGHVELRGEIP
jgi:hypothetical protein